MSGALGFVLLVAVTVAIWWRNHDILSDLYDYSSIIAAAGKIEAGLKPYVDFRSTMQSSTYFLNRGVEIVFGRNYLGLTGGGLLVAVGGAVALFALWRRSFGPVGGAMLAAAVVWSGLSQHVVVFYNTVGILCLAVVLTGVAQCPRFTRPWTWDQALVLGALLLGGMNKINFQCLGLALAAMLMIDAHLARRISRRDLFISLLVLAGAGVAAPFAIELAWTGATPALWFENVVLLADERLDFWRQLADPMVYVGPAHDLHFHIPFKRLTALGLGLLAVVGFQVWRLTRRDAIPGRDRFARGAILVVYVLGAALGGVLLTITNVETIALTSLTFIIAAAALWMATVQREAKQGSATPKLAWLLPAAGLFWAIDGGVAAWHGSRVLFGRETAHRGGYVRLSGAPPALRYLEGVRLDGNLHGSLLLVARELEQIKAQRGNLSGVLFGPTFEWLERAYPEAVLPGLPVWYHVGTSLRAKDGDWLMGILDRHGVNRILTHPGWESWPSGFLDRLKQAYRPVPLGFIARLHEKIGSEQMAMADRVFNAREPLTVIERTASNLHLLASPVPEGFDYSTSPWGDYLGAAGSWQWDWRGGFAIVEGQILARRSGNTSEPARVSISINALEGMVLGEELWRASATIQAGRNWVRVPFRVTPYGRPVRVRVEPEVEGQYLWQFGCRDVQIRQTTGLTDEPPPPTTVFLPGHRQELPDGTTGWFRATGASDQDRESWQTAPMESWVERASGATPWRVTLEAEPVSDEQATLPVVMLLWYRAGRIELLSQQVIERQGSREVSFEGWMPEAGGWVGVALRPLERDKAFNMKIRVKGWKYQTEAAAQ